MARSESDPAAGGGAQSTASTTPDTSGSIYGGHLVARAHKADVFQDVQAHESGKPSLINAWVDPDAYVPGTMNQTMYK
jgi:acetolactate synthase-1/2/3 large subunit